MTLVLELRDTVTGETPGRVVDGCLRRNAGLMTIPHRGTNRAYARRIVRTWAPALRSALDSLYKAAG